jgi:tetratricopeptide (TPR) repeat protein
MMRSTALLVLLASSVFLRPGPAHATAQTARAQPSGAAFDEEFEKARQLLQQHDYFNALKGFQRANQIAGGQSADAFLGMAQAMYGMKVYKNALEACDSALGFAQTRSEGGGKASVERGRLLARAHKLKGQVLEALGELLAAEAEFRAALAADPDARVADLHYELGVVLLGQHRDEEGIAELQKEIALRPNGTTADDARARIANPRRAREAYAPEFSFVATDGQKISLEALKGKAVLLDFWATWCDPCVKALPAVRKLQKAHATDPFVVVGISADEDEPAWRTFTGKNGMVWPQYRDHDHRMQRTFNVTAIPTYILIDGEGIEQFRVKDAGFDSARNLAAEIDRQIKLAAAARR